jgi:hypothetical protein
MAVVSSGRCGASPKARRPEHSRGVCSKSIAAGSLLGAWRSIHSWAMGDATAHQPQLVLTYVEP